MNIATGCLTFLSLIFILSGVMSKFLGISLLQPFFSSVMGYFIAANTCLLLALLVDKFDK
jgi:hypothetical protein